MKRVEDNRKNDKSLESKSRRATIKKAFYNAPKLLLLGSMAMIAPLDAAASTCECGTPECPPCQPFTAG